MTIPGFKNVTVDFIARGETEADWLIVLVEEGWAEPFEPRLLTLQDRLYGSVDAALDGELARQYPESLGKSITVQIDGYDLPRSKVEKFFSQFCEGIWTIPDYQSALRHSIYVSGIKFRIRFDVIQ